MASTFAGIEIGSRALTASQTVLDVIGQNTANVSTPGYTRQIVDIAASEPISYGSGSIAAGQVGTGVSVVAINRVRDSFVDQQVYSANGDQGALNKLRDTLTEVEQAYGEPNTKTGVGTQLSTFLNSFSDLAANPENVGIRSTVLNNAEALANEFRSVSTALNQINPEISAKVAAGVGVVNTIAGQIADLNKQIGLSVANGEHPNDLQDRRDQLLASLSSQVDINVSYLKNPQTGHPTGEVNVRISGFTLVDGDSANALPTQATPPGSEPGLLTASGEQITLGGGELYGLVKASTLVAGYQSDLNTLANNVITAVNTVHAQGYGLDGQTGRAFFSGTDAASIDVSAAVKSNLNVIAAAAAPSVGNTFASGNGDNATAIARLTSTPVIGNATLDDYYNSRIGIIGADTQSYTNQASSQEKIVQQLQNQQSSVSGVNLDEELTKMLQYQRSYQAAARVINTMDSVLNTIVNGLLTGL